MKRPEGFGKGQASAPLPKSEPRSAASCPPAGSACEGAAHPCIEGRGSGRRSARRARALRPRPPPRRAGRDAAVHPASAHPARRLAVRRRIGGRAHRDSPDRCLLADPRAPHSGGPWHQPHSGSRGPDRRVRPGGHAAGPHRLRSLAARPDRVPAHPQLRHRGGPAGHARRSTSSNGSRSARSRPEAVSSWSTRPE